MIIGIDAREFQAGRITGISRHLLYFLRYALSSTRAHKYVLFCNQETSVPLDSPDLKKVVIRERVTPVWDQIILPFKIAAEKVDVFLTPYFKAPLILPCHMVLIISDLIPLFFPDQYGYVRRNYFKFLITATARRATRIVTVSANSRRDIAEILGVLSDRVKVIHLGVEKRERVEDLTREEARSKYALPKQFILYVGNLSPHKYLEGLIKSYTTLPQDLRAQYKLVFGASKKDKYFPDLEIIVRDTGLTRDIVFTGFIEDKYLPALYSMSTLFAFPSLYEGFGLPPLEAMAYGTPVVSSNTSSMPEVLGDAAVLVDPRDTHEFSKAMTRILTDDDLRKLMVIKGLERVKLFTPEKMAQTLLQALEECQQNLILPSP